MQLDECRTGRDENLVERAAAGDSDAFAGLYDRFAPLVYGLALRVVRNPSLADEVAQDVFARVCATGASFDPSRGSARAWILTLAHRRAVDVVRRERPGRGRASRLGGPSGERPLDAVAEITARPAQTADVSDALASLSDVQRDAVELAYYQGLTHGEVAQALAIPMGTAKLRIRDGLRRLTTELAAAAQRRAELRA